MEVSPELQQAVASIINKALSGVDEAVSLLSTELPDVVHQLLLWKLVDSLLGVGVCLIVFILGVFFCKRLLQAHKNDEEWTTDYAGWSVPMVLSSIVTFSMLLVPFMVVWCPLTTALKIWIAPKIYLIEYAAQLVK